MNLSDLQIKDIVSIVDGKNLGRIVDVEINDEGHILYFLVEKKRLLWRFFGSSSSVSVSIKDIHKIGDDVILVKT